MFIRLATGLLSFFVVFATLKQFNYKTKWWKMASVKSKTKFKARWRSTPLLIPKKFDKAISWFFIPTLQMPQVWRHILENKLFLNYSWKIITEPFLKKIFLTTSGKHVLNGFPNKCISGEIPGKMFSQVDP